MTSVQRAAALALASLVAMPALAAEPYVYPKKGQSQDQIEKDKYACYEWAKGQTGFDPMQRPTATSAAPEEKGGAVRGAARGAAVGAVVGAIAGDAGKGAAVGAAGGGMMGGMRRRDSHREQEQWAQNQSAQYDAQRNEYDRAWAACLEGKDYTVR
jgi:hypothetical protein